FLLLRFRDLFRNTGNVARVVDKLFDRGESPYHKFGAVRGAAPMHASGNAGSQGQPFRQAGCPRPGLSAELVARLDSLLYERTIDGAAEILAGWEAAGLNDSPADILAEALCLIGKGRHVDFIGMSDQRVGYPHSSGPPFAQSHRPYSHRV